MNRKYKRLGPFFTTRQLQLQEVSSLKNCFFYNVRSILLLNDSYVVVRLDDDEIAMGQSQKLILLVAPVAMKMISNPSNNVSYVELSHDSAIAFASIRHS